VWLEIFFIIRHSTKYYAVYDLKMVIYRKEKFFGLLNLIFWLGLKLYNFFENINNDVTEISN